MSSLYLILHKVRGEPAFDIAQRCDDMGTVTDPGPWWIIPTSGHRAYPLDTMQMDDVVCELGPINPEDWPTLRDHYELEREPTTVRKSLSALLGRIMPPKDPLRVRRLDE